LLVIKGGRNLALFGYDKILDVDLSNGNIETRNIDIDFGRKYIGGLGFSLKILYDEVGPSVDPLSPENIVIFANGPLTGTRVPSRLFLLADEQQIPVG